MSSRSDRADRLKQLREAKLGKGKKQHKVRRSWFALKLDLLNLTF